MSGVLNLLIFRDAQNAENGKIAPNWNVSGTRDFSFAKQNANCRVVTSVPRDHMHSESLDPLRNDELRVSGCPRTWFCSVGTSRSENALQDRTSSSVGGIL